MIRQPHEDGAYSRRYEAYQGRYRQEPRESDKVLANILGDLLGKVPGGRASCLDIGCSTGNLLLSLRERFPTIDLAGGDLLPSAIEQCRADPRLAGIVFDVMDLMDLPMRERFDVVIANAVLYRFDATEFQHALRSLQRTLKPGGALILFDYYHAVPQEIEIIERFAGDDVSVVLFMRSFAAVRQAMAGLFEQVEFHPFSIPIDLAVPVEDRHEPNRHAALVSHTVRTDTGDRLTFRGSIYQPWCHVIARRRA